MKVNTKIVMTASALFLALGGILMAFLPQELLTYFGVQSHHLLILIVQILSALYLGFGLLNWTSKDTLIGGIYNKAITIGNLMHFSVGAIALAKGLSTLEEQSAAMIILTVTYGAFALLFAIINWTSPSAVSD